jgi:hypothetical protein
MCLHGVLAVDVCETASCLAGMKPAAVWDQQLQSRCIYFHAEITPYVCFADSHLQWLMLLVGLV